MRVAKQIGAGIFVLGLVLNLLSCGGGGGGGSAAPATTTPPPVPLPVITSFEVTPGEMWSGQQATLKAVFTDGTGTVDSSVGSAVGTVTSGTPVTVSPTSDASYTLTVKNSANQTVTRTAVLKVNQIPNIALSLKKNLITSGQAIQLVPDFPIGTATIKDYQGSVVTGQTIEIASPVVQAQTTLVYTMTVDFGSGITRTAEARVTVVPAPLISSFQVAAKTPAAASVVAASTKQSFKQPVALASTIDVTATATINWGGVALVMPVFDGGTGSISGIGPVESGKTYEVSPLEDTSYVLRVEDPAGSVALATANVHVIPPAIAPISPEAPTVTAGKTVQFSGATVSGAVNTGVQWSASAGSITQSGLFTAPMTAGSVQVTAASVAKPSVATNVVVAVVDAPVITAPGLVASTNQPSYGEPVHVTATFTGKGVLTDESGRNIPVQSPLDYTTSPIKSAVKLTLTATNTAGDSTTSSVSLTPKTVSVSPITTPVLVVTVGDPVHFGVTVTGAADSSIAWTATAGTMGSDGSWIAPQSAGSVDIKAASQADATKFSQVTIKVVDAPYITSFDASPATVQFGASADVSAVYTGGTGTVDQNIGAVASGGSFRVGPLSAPMDLVLSVKNEAGKTVQKALKVLVQPVNVGAIQPVLTVALVGSTTQFGSSVVGAVDQTVLWSATAGSITSGGLWTAPPDEGPVTITASSKADPTRKVTLTLNAMAAPVVNSFVATPTRVPYGGKASLLGTFQGGQGVVDGGVGPVVSGQGAQTPVLTTPAVYTLLVTNAVANAKSVATVDIETVTVGVTPGSATITVGDQRTFTGQAQGALDTSVNWSASGGTITTGGVFTAPSVPGVVAVTATSRAKSDAQGTAMVTVVAAPAVASFIATQDTVPYKTGTFITPVYSNGDGVVDQNVGSAASGAPIATGPLTGSKTWNLVVTNTAGSTATRSVTVNVLPVVVAPVAPATLTLTVGKTAQFTSAVTGAGDSTIQWSATGGQIDATGKYTAPAVSGTYTIKAASAADPTKAQTATVVVVDAPVAVSLVADQNPAPYGGMVSVVATFTGGDGVVDGGVGPVTSGVPVLYGPVTSAKSLNLTVTNASNDTATKPLSLGVQTVVVAQVAPATKTVTVGDTTAFTSSVTGASDPTVQWSASGPGTGTWTGTSWTAPAVAGTYTITAKSAADPSKTSTATIQVVDAPVATDLVATLSPVPRGGTTNVTPVFSHGVGTVDQGVGTVTSGTAFSTGVLTAPGTWNLTVKNLAGATATKSVTVDVMPVVVAPVSPATLTLTAGKPATFTSSITGAVDTTILWSATGGQIDATGKYTAPATAGTYTIKATASADSTKTSTATVQVVDPPVVTSFTANPSVVLYGAPTDLLAAFTGGTGTVDGGIGAVTSGQAKATPALFADATWNLTVTNPASDVATRAVSVTVTQPTISAVTPAAPVMSVGDVKAFAATVSGAVDSTITWSASAGSIAPDGTFTAPLVPGNVTITAASHAKGSVVASTVVKVVALPVIDSFSAGKTSLLNGESTLLTISYHDGVGVMDHNIGPVPSGTPYSTGSLTQSAAYKLTVTNEAGAKAEQSISITVATVSVDSVAPATITKTVNSTHKFTATVSGALNPAVTWTTTSGSIASDGTLTAPAAAQTVTVTATSVADTSKSATATVTVVEAPVIDSWTASVNPIEFGDSTNLLPVYRYGTGTVDQSIGAITSGGSKSTGSLTVPTTYRLLVTNPAGDSVNQDLLVSIMAVAVAPITPDGATATPGSAITFRSSVSGAKDKTIDWTASGGVIDANGVWVAPAAPGAYIITATAHAKPSIKATATVTVVSSPAIASFTAVPTTIDYGATGGLVASFTGATGVMDHGIGAVTTDVAATTPTLITNTSFRVFATSNATFDNLVPNGDAEVVAGQAVNDPVNARTGAGAFEMTLAAGPNQVPLAGPVPAAPGQAYRLQGAGKASAALVGTAKLRLRFLDASAAQLGAQDLSLGGALAYGSLGEAMAYAPAGTTQVDLQWLVDADPADAGAVAYLDDVALRLVAYQDVTVQVRPVVVGAVTPVGLILTTGHSATFSATVSQAVDTSITWSADAGTMNASTGAWVAPLVPGTYTITAKANADGATTNSVQVTVVPLATITSFTATTNPVPYGGGANMIPVFSGAVSASVNRGIGAVTSGGSYPTGALTTNTDYTLTLLNAAGDPSVQVLTVNVQAPVVSAVTGGGGYVSVGYQRTFSATVSNATNTTVNWSVDGIAGGNASVGTINGSGVYTGGSTTGLHTITATAAADGATSQSATITVVALPTASLSGTTNPLYGAPVTVTTSFTGGTATVGTSAGGTNVQASATNGGTYSTGAVTGTITHYIRCTNLAGQYVDGSIAITPQTVSVSAIANGGGYVSVGYTRSVSATTSGASNGNVNWTATGGSFSPTTTASGASTTWTAPGTPGTYTLTATSAGDASKSQTTTIIVVDLPTASLSGTTNPLYGAAVTVTTNFTGGTATVGTSAGGTNVQASATNGGTYSTGAVTDTLTHYIRCTNQAGQYVDGSITITPQTVSVSAISNGGGYVSVGYTRSVSATTSGASNGNVNWTATGGSFSPTTTASGASTTWTAPGTPGTYTLYATSAANGTTQTSTTITVVALPTASLSGTTNPLYGAAVTVTTNFTGGTATVGTSAGASNVQASATNGGTYSTGAVTGTITHYIRCTNQAGQYVDGSITITPQTVSVSAVSNGGGYVSVGYTRSVSATTSGASNGNVNWTATGGSFSPTTTASGASTTWTAPGTPGTYTLYATSAANGTTQTSTTITVVALPTVSSVTASPSSITSGQSSTITSVFSGGTGSVSPSIGAVNSGTGYGTGALSSTTTYTLTATNQAGQTASGAATVTVYPAATVSVWVDSTSITAGGGTYLNWSSTGASYVDIANYANGQATSGRVWIAPGGTTTYTGTAYNPVGSASGTSSATVTVYAVATVSVWVDSTSITSGGGTYLNWSSTGASYVNIANYGNSLGTSGRVWIAPGGTTTYTGTAYNPLGSASGNSAATVTVYAAATVSVWVDSSNITSGGGTYLNWSSTGASYVNIANYGNGQGTSGRAWIAPGGTTTYTGVAYNPAGSASGGSAATVTVWAAPSISSFYASPSTINSGQSSTLYPTFSAPGGSASISGIGGVSSGGAYGTGALTSTTGYTLTVTNGAGASTSAGTTVTVNTAPPPVISDFHLNTTTSNFSNDCGTDGLDYGTTTTYVLVGSGVWDSVSVSGPWAGSLSYTTTTMSDDLGSGTTSNGNSNGGAWMCTAPPIAFKHPGTYTLTATRNGQTVTATCVVN